MNFLRIATWNINGLSPNTHEVELFIHHNKIDILLISETHMIDERIVTIKGCNIYYCNHPDGTSHAGAAIVVRDNIKQHALPNHKQAYLQAAVLSVDQWQGTLNVAAVYCPPRHRIDEKMFCDFFKTLGGKFVAGGDWNSKNTFWGSRLTTTRGRELKKAIESNALNVLSSGEPTYWPTDPNKSPDLIDFFVTGGIPGLYTKVESCLDGSSDHTAVICTLSTTVIYREPRETLYNSRTDWEAFREYINENASLKISLKTEEEVENATCRLTNLIQTAAWLSTPCVKSTPQNKNYPLEVRNKIAEKRRLRRKWHASRNVHDKRSLNRAQKELKEMLKSNENHTLQEHLRSLSSHRAEDYSLWKMTKTFKRPKKHLPALRQPNGGWARSSAEKAELFADFVEEVFQPNESNSAHSEDDIDDVINSDQQMSLPLQLVKPREVWKHITQLKQKKAPGFDLITAEILKQLPKKGIVLVTIIFNSVLRLQYFPLLWKVSVLNMIPKPGKPASEVSSYRPISLLPVLSKLFEKLLLKRLHPILADQNVIPDHQFGFREHHGTVEQIHRVAHTIRQTMERKEYCSAVFLDVQQAFDRVWHRGLLYKLKLCLPHTAYMLLKSYLEHRLFQIRVEDSVSDLREIKAGVPQGSVLGPVLYTLYTSDLPTSAEVVTATYADDTAVLSCSVDPYDATKKLQEHLNKIDSWFKKWRIKASASKSTHITFTLKRQDCPSVKLDGTVLPHQAIVKYLGMHLDRKLTWKNHIKAKRDLANRKVKEMHWLIGRQSALSLENKILIYKAIIRPIWTYGIELWGSASHSNVEILQRFQNTALKHLCNAPWYTKNVEVHEHLQIQHIRDDIEKSCETYLQRLECHKNHLAAALLDSSHNIKRLKRMPLATI